MEVSVWRLTHGGRGLLLWTWSERGMCINCEGRNEPGFVRGGGEGFVSGIQDLHSGMFFGGRLPGTHFAKQPPPWAKRPPTRQIPAPLVGVSGAGQAALIWAVPVFPALCPEDAQKVPSASQVSSGKRETPVSL